MRFLIETGSEEHTSSYASLQAKYHGGEHDGKYLYQVKSRQVSTEWDERNDKHQKWVTTVYDLPEGTEIEIIGKAFDGNVHLIYRLDPAADVIDTQVLGSRLRGCQMKGRLVLVKDVLASKLKSIKESQQEGF